MANSFGYSHTFWLAIIGVTVIGSLEAGSVVKGLLSGCIGMWLATIGFDDIQGVKRFVFHPALGGGVNIIPALIGLFAIPQVITMFAKGRFQTDIKQITVKKHPISQAFREVFSRKRALAIGTSIGSVIGLIPGVGGQIAGLLAYDQAKKFSPEKAKFGTGHSEGVIAAESANNATAGGALIMMMALGIPGDIVTAVMLGALMIHNVIPGPSFIQDEPLLAYGIFIAFFAAHFFMLGLQAFSLRLFLLVTRVPMYVLASIILAYCAIGVFSLHNITFDIWVMFGFGVIGYFMRKLGFPLAPMILGVVLGKLAELNIARAVGTSDDYFLFLTRPWSLFFILMAVVSILFPFYQNAHKDTFFSKIDNI